ncbi:hypothetical protein C8R44DRAFT_891847 [Mycena epipterygia]|nr:hypothetical protein C8R44DRAFT_891847 [Mycena epipterygia]
MSKYCMSRTRSTHTSSITDIEITALLAEIVCRLNPISRQYLNRVSIMSNPVFSGPSAKCIFMTFFGLSILMFFRTALNLQFVRHYRTPNGDPMEKFYYIGSVTAIAILNIAPYAAGQFEY